MRDKTADRSPLRTNCFSKYELGFGSLPGSNNLEPILVLATAALAVFTARLFAATRDVAKKTGELAQKTNEVAQRTQELAQDTVAASKWIDKCHQESLAPLLRFRGSVEITDADPERQVWQAYIRGTIRNTGLGTAKTCSLLFHFGPKEHVGPVGPREAVNVDVRIPSTGKPPKAGIPWTITLNYDDFFGKETETLHIGHYGSLRYSTIYKPAEAMPRNQPS